MTKMTTNSMRKFKSIACIVMLSTCQLAYGLQPAAASLDQLLAPITSLKARFKQTVFTDKKKIIQESSGYMEFKKPLSFRWQVEKPDKNLIVTNGEKLWNYDEDLEQVTVRKFGASKEVSPVSFLFDDINKLDADFTIAVVPNTHHDLYCYKLTPKQENQSFVNVEVCFNGSQITSMYLLDHLHQTSKFEFNHVQRNVSIASTRFTFEPPTGVDVVGES